MWLFRPALLSCLIWFGCSSVSAQLFTIHPPNPTTNDIITINVSSGSSPPSWSGATVQANKIVIRDFRAGLFSAPGSLSKPLGLLPAGNYSLFVQAFASTGAPPVPDQFKFDFTVSPAAAQTSNLELEGVWQNPEEPGRALYLVQTPDSLAGAVLAHDVYKQPTWYLMQGHWVTAQEFRGTLFRYTGTNLGEAPQRADYGHVHAGAVTLIFTSSSAASVTYHLDSIYHPPNRQDRTTPIVKAKYR